jgi:VanZ family protein
MAAIFFVSSLAQPPLPPGVNDKTGHSFGYMGLAIVVLRAIAGGLPRRITWAHAAPALLIAIAYGMSDEFHQSFVPGRSEDIHDLYADATGALIGVVACWAWGIIHSSRSHV